MTVKKEPVAYSLSSGVNIKSEPRDINISERFATNSVRSSVGPTVANAASNRATGTPQPKNSNANTVNVSASGQGTIPFRRVEDDRVPKKLVYSIYRNANDINYTPEGVLSEGHAMAKAMKQQLSKLHVGNKMRQEVWRKEVTRCVNSCESDLSLSLW